VKKNFVVIAVIVIITVFLLGLWFFKIEPSQKGTEPLEGYWEVTRVLQEVHFDKRLPEPDFDQVEYWDPENEWDLVGREVELFFWIYPDNTLITEEALETDIVWNGKDIYFETEWLYSRIIKWVGETNDDCDKINGTWEMFHPIHGIMSSGNWSATKLSSSGQE
jgi:hypothetical protein